MNLDLHDTGVDEDLFPGFDVGKFSFPAKQENVLACLEAQEMFLSGESGLLEKISGISCRLPAIRNPRPEETAPRREKTTTLEEKKTIGFGRAIVAILLF